MRVKYVGPVHLPIDLYQLLEQRARAEERDALQQARWMLRQALDDQRQPEPGELVEVIRPDGDGPRVA